MKTLDKVGFFLIEGTLIVEYNGKSSRFERAPLEVMDLISDDFARNPDAEKALIEKGITEPLQQLRQFAICRYVGECTNNCKYRGRICVDALNPHSVNKFSTFEINTLKKIAAGTPPYIVATQMHTSYTNVRRIVARAKHKLNISTHAGLGAWAAKIGIV